MEISTNIGILLLERIRLFLDEQSIDAMVIFSSDPHQSEYLAAHWQIIPVLTNFTGSNASVLITADQAQLWTDSRYWIQAENEIENSPFELKKFGMDDIKSPIDWACKFLPKNSIIGIDGALISQSRLISEQKRCAKHDQKIKLLQNTFEVLWKERPQLPVNQVYFMPLEVALYSTSEKIQILRSEASDAGADALLFTDLDDICWILHVRGSDIECNTGIISYLIIGPTHTYWFVDEIKLNEEIKNYCNSLNIEILPYSEINDFINEVEFSEWKYIVDPAQCNAELFQKISPGHSIQLSGVVGRKKAIKSNLELDAIRKTMIEDGVALCGAYHWLENEHEKGNLNELDISRKLTTLRAQSKQYQTDSFHPIVGWKENGAIVHYHPTQGSSAQVEGDGVLLIDSGGHYLTGTTDITRTTCFGKPSIQFALHYTLVLKGHISLAMAIFPKGTTGVQLDILARQHLWQAYKNFGHGTGHGVGFCANVHEGPQSISPRVSNTSKTALKPGMLVTNEPGYYEENKYGIRIENILLVQEVANTKGAFLEFNTLTLFPIDTSQLMHSMLNPKEIEWLNNYHNKVREKLIPCIPDEGQKFWILDKTRPL